MKILKTVIATVIVLGSFNLVLANENVDTKIANIKGATPQARVKLMNEFKVQLAAMNAQDRADAISQLRTQVQMQKGSKAGMASSQMLNKEMHIQKVSQTDQMNQVQSMNQLNIMNQKQMGSMVGNLPIIPGLMPMSPGILPGSVSGTMPATGATMPAVSGVIPVAGGAHPAATTTPTQPAAISTPSSSMTRPTH